MWLYIVIALTTRIRSLAAVVCFGENHVAVRLSNGSIYDHRLHNPSQFPDIERLFRIHGLQVKELCIRGTQITQIDNSKLKNLVLVEKLEITWNRRLKRIGNDTFIWNQNLQYLNLDSNGISFISPWAFNGLFHSSSVRGVLHLSGNDMRSLPDFRMTFPGLLAVHLDNNPINFLSSRPFSSMNNLGLLSMKETFIEEISNNIFSGSSRLHHLLLNDNRYLQQIDDFAFVGTSIKVLDLSGTSISALPSKGLNYLEELKLENMPLLFEIPYTIVEINTLRKVKISGKQPYLCCAFEMKKARLKTRRSKRTMKEENSSPIVCPTALPSTTKIKSRSRKINAMRRSTLNVIGYGFVTRKDNRSSRYQTKQEGKGIRINRYPPLDDFVFPTGVFHPVSHIATYSSNSVICVNHSGPRHVDELVDVSCVPTPDALHPCDDIMGNQILTLVSWLVSLLGLLANIFVFSVLSLSRRQYTVTKFLLQNLSFADMCLSLYLFVLVCASTYTHGEYYNYVSRWQYGGGCAVAGVLAIFSSQLSMLVLSVITLERYFAIVHVMHFNFKLSFTKAKITMLCCWSLAAIVSVLPLSGVNTYNQVAICLPFRTLLGRDLIYLSLLLGFNVLLFLFVMFSYVRMYMVFRSPHLDKVGGETAAAGADIAKRMALLVFTDFFCWVPIAFVALSSVFAPDFLSIDVKRSKYLLVIFFPINAVCNPFLYAASTTSFKRDIWDALSRFGFCTERVLQMESCGNARSVNAIQRLDTGSTSLYQRFSTKTKKSIPREASPLLVDETCGVGNDMQNQKVESKVLEQQVESLPVTSKEDGREKMVEKLPLVRVRSNSDGRIANGLLSPAYKEITFDFRITAESFEGAKETVGL